MKPADDPNNPKILVQQSYDRCAATYNEARKNEAGPELHFLTRNLEDGAAVLDVGCGVGVPYTQALEVWPESHLPGFTPRQADVLQSNMG